ncbi:MAG: DoxX family protein [Parcubacteria group bacterium]
MQKISSGCHDEDGDNTAYTVFRLIVSAMFFMHGAQKFFGLFGGIGGHGAVPFFSLFWFAGLVEVVVGLLVFFGVFTRLAALLGVIEMLVAYFLVHFPAGLNPLFNGGEVALLYLASFLVMFRYGAGKLSLEKKIRKRELF